ncbi:DUF4397 domain-containing protein [Flavobacterium psychrotrophum]|uniref:DUF4397 domain-containing protein n=1 Tax=Flavobacterium psychrotrophum TaxID=2294119 RepID=UPI000E314F42|nr:DUF4397 domain-containing protein [Flavobacterium psychrotrophum]
MKLNFISKMMLGTAAAITMLSCNIDDDSTYYTPDNNIAFSIIANASPSSGDLYFYADANRINATPSVYGTAEGYFRLYTGKRVLSLKDATGTLLDSTTVNLKAGDVFSAFAVNTYNNVELVTYNDTLQQPEAGQALVRFINLSPDAGAVDISGLNQTFATGVDFKEATNYVSVKSGTYDITFKNSTGAVLYTAKAEDFYSGSIYTIYTKGFATPPTGSNDTFSTKKLRNY